MKRFVKTLKELRATEGLVEQNGNLYLKGKASSPNFVPEMREYCGKELIGTPNERGNIYANRFYFSPWMWKEVEDNPTEGLEFPCKMFVRDFEHKEWEEREIHGHIPTFDNSWIDSKGIGWYFAKPIPKFKPRFIWAYIEDKWTVAHEIEPNTFTITGSGVKYSGNIELGEEIKR